MLNPQKHTIRLSESPFRLESGEILPHVDIAFYTYGELNADRTNVIVLAHALLNNPPAHEWLKGLLGDGLLLDTSKYFVISANLLGSCYGSTGPESVDPRTGAKYLATFPAITIRDIARAQLCVLDALNIPSVALALGGSMGGMIVLELAAQAPSRFRAIAPLAICGAHPVWGIAFGSIILKTITSQDPTLQDRERLRQGLLVASQLAYTICRSHSEFRIRFDREQNDRYTNVEKHLLSIGTRVAQNFSVYSYLILMRALVQFDLRRGRGSFAEIAKTIECPAFFAGSATDALYDPNEIEAFAKLFPRGEYHTLEADHGHDSFLADPQGLIDIVAPFIAQLESTR